MTMAGQEYDSVLPARAGEVDVYIYNVLGQRVLHYKIGAQRAGRYQQHIDMSPFASGVYFYELRVRAERREAFREVRKSSS